MRTLNVGSLNILNGFEYAQMRSNCSVILKDPDRLWLDIELMASIEGIETEDADLSRSNTGIDDHLKRFEHTQMVSKYCRIPFSTSGFQVVIDAFIFDVDAYICLSVPSLESLALAAV